MKNHASKVFKIVLCAMFFAGCSSKEEIMTVLPSAASDTVEETVVDTASPVPDAVEETVADTGLPEGVEKDGDWIIIHQFEDIERGTLYFADGEPTHFDNTKMDEGVNAETIRDSLYGDLIVNGKELQFDNRVIDGGLWIGERAKPRIERGTVFIDGVEVNFDNTKMDMGIDLESLKKADHGTVVIDGTEVTFDNRVVDGGIDFDAYAEDESIN